MKNMAYGIITVFVLALGLVACGGSGSGGGDDPGPGAPRLSNLSFPSETHRGETVVVSFDYSDPEGDITMLYTTDVVQEVRFTNSFTADEMGISGTSGRVTFVHDTNRFASYGTHHIEIWVEDEEHHTSNRLTHNLEVLRR